jgi:hypothetical protein
MERGEAAWSGQHTAAFARSLFGIARSEATGATNLARTCSQGYRRGMKAKGSTLFGSSLFAVTTTLLATSAGAAGTSASARTTRSFLVDVQPGNARSFGKIEVVGVDGDKRAKIDLTVSTDLVNPGQDAAPKPKGKAKEKAPLKAHAVTVEVDVKAADAVASVEVQDLNFDGYRDLWLLREKGKTGARFEALIFDPAAGKFTRTTLAGEIDKLDNPEVDPLSRRLISRRFGESRHVHKVVGSRLAVVESCEFSAKPSPDTTRREGRLVVKRVVDGAMTTVTDKEVALPVGHDPCE